MGLAAAERAMEHAKRTDEIWFTPRVHAVMSGLYAKRGNEAKVQEHSEIVRHMQAKHNLALPFVTLAD